jgi:hypothetical protein
MRRNRRSSRDFGGGGADRLAMTGHVRVGFHQLQRASQGVMTKAMASEMNMPIEALIGIGLM